MTFKGPIAVVQRWELNGPGRNMLSIFQDVLDDESGLSAIEYALMCSIITILAWGGLIALGDSVIAVYDMIANSIPGPPGG